MNLEKFGFPQKLFFPNSDSELKGSTSGQKIGPEDTVQGGPATLVLKPGRLLFIAIYMTW